MIPPLQLPAQIYTVSVRQHDVQHNQICRVPPKLFPCFGGSPRPEHLITVQRKHLGVDLHNVWIVLYQ